MRPMRERMAQPRLTNPTGTEGWEGAPCLDLDIAFLWDLELDCGGQQALAETKAAREQRHNDAIAMCHDCPALALCAAQSVEGRQGVIAGKVIR